MVTPISLADLDPDPNYFEDNENHNNSQFYTIRGFNDLFKSDNSFIKILHHNIRSFSANSDSLLSIFDSSTVFPEILVLSETWFSPDTSHDIPGFSSYHTIRDTARSGGVSIFVAENFSSSKIESISFCSQNLEVCCIKTKIYGTDLRVVGVYRPHGGNIESFISELESVLNERSMLNKSVIILGDFNLDLIGENNENDRSLLMNCMYSFHFIPVISKPTRFSGNSSQTSTLIDHIWINKLTTYTSGIILTDVSDHCPIFLMLPVNLPSSVPKIRLEFRDESETNMRKLEEALLAFNWNLIDCNDVNDRVIKFSNVFYDLYCKNCPLKIKYVSGKKVLNPWMNPGLSELVKCKSQYYKLYLQGFITKIQNNTYRNKVNSIIRKAKNTYYQYLFERNKSDIKSTWKIIRNLTSRNTIKSHISELIWNNHVCTGDEEIAEAFNDYFSSVALDLDSRLGNSNTDPLLYVNSNVNSMYLTPLSPHHCSKIIQNLKNSRSSIDLVPPRIFKSFRDIISAPISDIVNQCFSQGIYPNSLKYAIITPIFKKGDPKNPSNYRPISVTSFINKIFEKAIYEQLSSFFTQCNIISPNQYGFIKNCSTQDALNNLTEFYHDTLNRKESAVTVFIDYSKAFDTINHSILIRKLFKCGIRGIPLDLLASYLDNRTQAVRIGKHVSQPNTINIGVPQGTTLGPLIFLLYINDLPDVVPHSHTVLFADDTTLSFRNSSNHALTSDIRDSLAKFMEWSVANRLSINFEKTYSMLITTKNISENEIPVFMNTHQIEFVPSIKYLGVTLDKNLKFNIHTNLISLKVSKSIGVLYRLRNLLPSSCLRNIYFSLIQTYFQYCISVWGSTYACHLRSLTVLQKRAIRIISDAPFLAHSTPLFNSANILKLNDLYFYNLGVIVYCQKIPLIERSHSHRTRFRHHFLPPFSRLSLTQHSISFRAISFWNNLPDSIKNSPSLFSFKNRLKIYFISQYEI